MRGSAFTGPYAAAKAGVMALTRCVALETVEDGFGETRLSREKAKRAESWMELEAAYEKNDIVSGVINGKVKARGKNIVTDLKESNIGQAVVVRNGYVIAIESSDGSDAMLHRASILLKRFILEKKKEGILLKFPKRNQDLRIDLPTVGIKTINRCD